ncbi:MAG TPA: class I SAM-dependent methyltransferase [Polyangia bacterium]|nr:class I SAM-dependent methyltransferase [Polyangia bacterium]
MNIPGAIMIGQLWWYGAAVLRPAQLLKSAGLYPDNSLGRRPAVVTGRGGGPFFSRRNRRPVLLPRRPDRYDLVEEFDGMSDVYSLAVDPFAKPIFEETIAAITPYIASSARVLDPSCGPGLDLCHLATLVPEGEVVGADLAEKMVLRAADNARQRGIENAAFFQADVTSLPKVFQGRFDAVFCSLSFHHYTDPLRALQEMRRVLRPGGHAFITDAGPGWMKLLGSPIAKIADPGWVAFRTGEEFRELCQRAGFAGFYWNEILPGMGLTIATR